MNWKPSAGLFHRLSARPEASCVEARIPANVPALWFSHMWMRSSTAYSKLEKVGRTVGAAGLTK